jgi:CBS domain-containing protein
MATSTSTKLSAIQVREIMTSDVTAISYDDTLHQGLVIMADEKLTAIPVINYAGVCQGILSRSDLGEMFVELDDCVERMADAPFRFGGDFPDGFRTKVREFMNPDVLTIGAEDSVVHAAAIMAKHRIHHLPVVDEEAKLVGIVSTLDLAKMIAAAK